MLKLKQKIKNKKDLKTLVETTVEAVFTDEDILEDNIEEAIEDNNITKALADLYLELTNKSQNKRSKWNKTISRIKERITTWLNKM